MATHILGQDSPTPPVAIFHWEDEVISRIDRAWALSQLCCTTASRDATEVCDWDSIVGVVHLVRDLVHEACNLPGAHAAAKQALKTAQCVADVVASDVSVEMVGREGKSWSDEITASVLWALAEAVVAAREAIMRKPEQLQ